MPALQLASCREEYITNVIRTDKMHTFFINDLIQLYCLRHVSNIPVFIFRKTCTCILMVFLSCINISSIKHILPSTRLLIRMHERNIIKRDVQVFLRMNTWLFETCRRHYNWIWSLMKNCAVYWFFLHMYTCISMRGSKNVKCALPLPSCRKVYMLLTWMKW